MHRRKFLSSTVGGATIGLVSTSPLLRIARAAAKTGEIKAVAFDAFPIFDPRPILKLAHSLAPNHEGFGTAWFNKIFSYTWLRTSAGQYRDFHSVIGDALDYTTRQKKIVLSSGDRELLLGAWLRLDPWPDAAVAVRQLQDNGIRLAFLSNFTEDMLRANAANAGMEAAFSYFSTDLAGAFKPDPKAYQVAIDRLGLAKKEIAFCAFAAWDAAGASWFGYPTVWVNRLGQTAENLGTQPTVTGQNLSALLSFVKGTGESPKVP